jgi:hypothetical protein
MPRVVSDIYLQSLSKRKEDPKEELKRMKRTAILFIKDNPTPLFVQQWNAEKQAVSELEFSEEVVENPEVRKEKLRQYIC